MLNGTATVTIGGETVNKLGPGDWFGELALLSTGGVRTATVKADTDLECVGLTAWEFRPLPGVAPRGRLAGHGHDGEAPGITTPRPRAPPLAR